MEKKTCEESEIIGLEENSEKFSQNFHHSTQMDLCMGVVNARVHLRTFECPSIPLVNLLNSLPNYLTMAWYFVGPQICTVFAMVGWS